MSRSEFAGTRVLVVGLGISGFSAARALVALDAKVRVTEAGGGDSVMTRAQQLRALGVEVEVGGHDLGRLDADLAVISPGIPPASAIAEAIRAQGLQLWSEIELAYRLAECDFLAVTGTNGKTTTTSLLAAILQEAGVSSAAAGNIGFPLIDAISSVPAGGAIALEVSSFQLVGTERFRPKVGVLLNVAEDHTDWHGSFEAYREAKARLVANQTAEDVFLYNLSDPNAKQIATAAASRLVPFSADEAPPGGIGSDGTDITWNGTQIVALEDVPIPGRPGIEDCAAAAGAALEYGIDIGVVERAVRAFKPLSHRFHVIARVDGVSYIDDSKATNPHATLAALDGLSDVVLIAGGRSKGMDLRPLRSAAPSLVAVVAMGEATEELKAVFEGVVEVVAVASMDDAVAVAATRSVASGSVLLSPGCASLDMYESYAARGEDFARAVGELVKDPGKGTDGNA